MTDRIAASNLLSDIISEKEAGQMLFARPQTLRNWRHRRKGPPYLRLAGKIKYKRSDVLAFIESSRVDPAKESKKTQRRNKGRK